MAGVTWLILVGFKMVDVDDTQLESLGDKSGGVDTCPFPIAEKTAHEVVLTLFERLHTEWHSTKLCYLVLGKAQSQMAKESLVVLIYLIIDHGF